MKLRWYEKYKPWGEQPEWEAPILQYQIDRGGILEWVDVEKVVESAWNHKEKE